jgi:hypothetical protein
MTGLACDYFFHKEKQTKKPTILMVGHSLEYLIETNFAYATNNTFVFNKEDNCIEVFDIYKHDYIFAIKPEDFGNKSIMKEKYDLYFQKYKIIYVFENTMDTLKELYFNKLMTIVTE